MKLYQARIPGIAKEVIELLVKEGSLDVTAENRAEAELDLVAIMDEFLRRDRALRESVREQMHTLGVSYDQYGKVRSRLADTRGHPTGDDVGKFLARQFVENFMISRFIDEVYADDRNLYKRVLEIVRSHHVNEKAIREEAMQKIKNVEEGTVEYEIALSQAIREVKQRYGLVREKGSRNR